MNKPRILAIVGCTGGGKTALSVELAKRTGGEIVSCDSMQIYTGMDVGTAKPDMAERAGVPHHLIDVADPHDSAGYSCADYVKDARAAVDGILARGHLPILCGGTGLYLDAFLRGGTFAVTDTDPALRASLQAFADEQGAEALHARLAAVDPASAAAVHPNNIKRVIRALEIYETTGRRKSELDVESRAADCPYDALVVGLRYNCRAVLYDRIDRRVDAMLAAGLADETRRLRAEGVFDTCATAAQAIGYKELFPWLDGQATLAEVTDTLKTATRRYAKRQITWFSAKEYVTWVDMDAPDGSGSLRDFEEIVNNVQILLNRL